MAQEEKNIPVEQQRLEKDRVRCISSQLHLSIMLFCIH